MPRPPRIQPRDQKVSLEFTKTELRLLERAAALVLGRNLHEYIRQEILADAAHDIDDAACKAVPPAPAIPAQTSAVERANDTAQEAASRVSS